MSSRVLGSVATLALMAMTPSSALWSDPNILSPNSKPYGKSYGQWSGYWWRWFMQHPIAGHPSIDDPAFNVTSGQSGQVWFLAGCFGTVTRNVTIPAGKALFVGLLNAEFSSNEGFLTEQDQRDEANFFADHIVVSGMTCSIDGDEVDDITKFRCESPQFTFTAPDPWIFSPANPGPGTFCADGYFVMLRPLSVGQHVLHYTGSFHFDIGEIGNPEPLDFGLDMTYHITVQ
jgi:hypothetical protein